VFEHAASQIKIYLRGLSVPLWEITLDLVELNRNARRYLLPVVVVGLLPDAIVLGSAVQVRGFIDGRNFDERETRVRSVGAHEILRVILTLVIQWTEWKESGFAVCVHEKPSSTDDEALAVVTLFTSDTKLHGYRVEVQVDNQRLG